MEQIIQFKNNKSVRTTCASYINSASDCKHWWNKRNYGVIIPYGSEVKVLAAEEDRLSSIWGIHLIEELIPLSCPLTSTQRWPRIGTDDSEIWSDTRYSLKGKPPGFPDSIRGVMPKKEAVGRLKVWGLSHWKDKLLSPKRRTARDRASLEEWDKGLVVIHIMSETASSHANGDI